MSETIPMTPERWATTQDYVTGIFSDPDPQLESLMHRAQDAGLPNIAVTPDVGRLLALLIATTPGRKALELGTLGGYSSIWIARALRPGGHLVTVENDEKAARFAAREFEAAGVESWVEIKLGSALEVLPGLAARFGTQSLDFAFVDAEKEEYLQYWKLIRPLIAPGGYFVADNVLGAGTWWIDDTDHPARAAVDNLSREVAADSHFQSVMLTQRQGLLVARRRS